MIIVSIIIGLVFLLIGILVLNSSEGYKSSLVRTILVVLFLLGFLVGIFFVQGFCSIVPAETTINRYQIESMSIADRDIYLEIIGSEDIFTVFVFEIDGVQKSISEKEGDLLIANDNGRYLETIETVPMHSVCRSKSTIQYIFHVLTEEVLIVQGN